MGYYYIVAAAGVGKRMGLDYPKQFLEVDKKPIFIKTLEVIVSSPLVDGVVLVTNEEYIEKVREYCKIFNIDKILKVVAGGAERQDSIYNGLMEIPKGSIVGIQDGVRPFIEPRYIQEGYKMLGEDQELDGVVVGVPVKDTIKVCGKDGSILKTPRRETLFAAQTPQIFKLDSLLEGYREAKSQGFLGTDDSSLVERKGGKILTLMGSYKNIKITTPEDLIYLEEEKN